MTKSTPVNETQRRGVFSSVRVATMVGLASLMLSGLAACHTNQVSGKVVDGQSSVVLNADSKDERFAGPGLEGAEAELRAVRDGLGERMISKAITGADGSFSIGTEDRLTSETFYLIVSKAGCISAKGPVSITAQGKKTLVVLKKVAH